MHSKEDKAEFVAGLLKAIDELDCWDVLHESLDIVTNSHLGLEQVESADGRVMAALMRMGVIHTLINDNMDQEPESPCV